jgi:ribosomal protein S19E (S16A)
MQVCSICEQSAALCCNFDNRSRLLANAWFLAPFTHKEQEPASDGLWLATHATFLTGAPTKTQPKTWFLAVSTHKEQEPASDGLWLATHATLVAEASCDKKKVH